MSAPPVGSDVEQGLGRHVNVIEPRLLNAGHMIGEGAYGKVRGLDDAQCSQTETPVSEHQVQVFYGTLHNQEVAIKVLTAGADNLAQMTKEVRLVAPGLLAGCCANVLSRGSRAARAV